MEELKEGWRLENLEENLEVILDYRGKTPQKSEKGRVTLSAKSVKMGYIDYSNIYYVSEETYSKFMTRGLPKKGDILLTTEAPLGCVAELKDDSVCLAQRLITLRGKKEKLNNKYLLYYLQSPRGQYELLSKATGTTVQGIKRTEFSKVKILMPSLEKQNKIASILSSLDEKIELNRKINQNLEETAQTLFKRWFIDFEFPNEEGKPYKSSGGKMIESELGEIPEGWTIEKLENIIKIIDNRGKTPPFVLNKTNYPIIDVKSLSNENRIIDFNNCSKYITKETYDTWFRNGHPEKLDILISTVGSLAELKIFIENKGCIAQNIVAFRNLEYPLYLYQYLKYIKKELITYNIGSVQPSIKITHIIKYPIIIPEINIAKNFNEKMIFLTEKIYNNQKEIEKLIELRDYLLPRLMSGEISV